MKSSGALWFYLMLAWPSSSFAATIPQSQLPRPKVKITFDRTSFQVSYGQTIEFCMKVEPATRFTPKVQFASTPAGALEGKFGGTATCPATYSSIQVKAPTATTCVASANLLIRVNNRTVKILPGTIIIPTSETMAKQGPVIRDCSTVFAVSGTQFDFVDQWLATETSASAGLNLTGVPLREDLTVLTNNCSGIIGQAFVVGQTETNSTVLPGVGVTQPNQWIDLVGYCGFASVQAGQTPPTNCAVTRRQAITVGSCFIQNNTLTISFNASGSVSTNRTP